MHFTVGLSPCPNDTFIFDALVNRKIDTAEFFFEPVLADVETLNSWALEQKLDITKVSYGVLPLLADNYNLLDAGGALGMGVGPLLISRTATDLDKVNEGVVAIPGRHTTANTLFSLAFPKAMKKKFMMFSAVEDAVLEGKADFGVIIHENRFTYMKRGLIKILDLGEYWEAKTKAPIPLGGIVVRKGLSTPIAASINTLIIKSIYYSKSQYPALSDFVKANADQMDETVMRQHIDLYVNHYSITRGSEGDKAVESFMDIYKKKSADT